MAFSSDKREAGICDKCNKNITADAPGINLRYTKSRGWAAECRAVILHVYCINKLIGGTRMFDPRPKTNRQWN